MAACGYIDETHNALYIHNVYAGSLDSRLYFNRIHDQ